MAKRISLSQFQSKIRQAQSKIRQATNKYNQEVRTHNARVRSHNARVRANRDRLLRELQKLTRATSQPQYITFRTSVETVQRSYTALEARAAAYLYDDRLNVFLDLSEREAANSVSVMNTLQGEIPENEISDEIVPSDIDHILIEMSPEVRDRWRGALFALNPRNPDAARHFCTSARELLTEILEKHAKDDDVSVAILNCERTQEGKPTRRSKIRFLLDRNGISDDALTDFVEKDMGNVVELFHIFNDGAHGSSGRFTHPQLMSIRARVEGAVSFLWRIISGNAFQAV